MFRWNKSDVTRCLNAWVNTCPVYTRYKEALRRDCMHAMQVVRYLGEGPGSWNTAHTYKRMLRSVLISLFVLQAMGVQQLQYPCPSKDSRKQIKVFEFCCVVANTISRTTSTYNYLSGKYRNSTSHFQKLELFHNQLTIFISLTSSIWCVYIQHAYTLECT